ncbi:15-hydroxyprostaglandin dehydrogenase [NAD(+)]-like [Colletes latitarsis]|uniref:15-hydroxyprostaglandin dehydrogenase [NAD(+)]-like n=1 Tax=Colletes latitarsis TaxID=2605962 RepID=UPI004036E71F
MDNIKNKTVLITGAAGGLGLAFAENLLQNGAKAVAILDLSTSPGETTAATLEKEFGKGKAIFLPCDVTNTKLFEETFKRVVDTLGSLDIVINNAGICFDRKWEQTLRVNIGGVIQGSLLAIDHMGKHKGGKGGVIANIASIAGLLPYHKAPVYSATKHAVVGFSRCLQENYSRTGVRVLVLCPSFTDTSILKTVTQRTLDFIDEDPKKNTYHRTIQSADHVGKAMVGLIQKGGNAGIWIVENAEPPYAVEILPAKRVDTPQ